MVGLLCGREHSFPPAFIQRVGELGAPHGISAAMVSLGGTKMDEAPRYRVIVDRISHEVEYYRGFLKLAVLNVVGALAVVAVVARVGWRSARHRKRLERGITRKARLIALKKVVKGVHNIWLVEIIRTGIGLA